MVQGIVLKNNDVLITSNIEKIVPDDYNDPDLDIEKPYILKSQITKNSYVIQPYLSEYTNQTTFSFRSEDILTMFTPNVYIIEEYKKQTGVEEQLELNIETPENVNDVEE